MLAQKGGMKSDEFTTARDVAVGGRLRKRVTYARRAFAPQSGCGTAVSTAPAAGGLFAGYPSAVAAPVLSTGTAALSLRQARIRPITARATTSPE